MAARSSVPGTLLGVQLSLKSLNFGPFLYENGQKVFNFTELRPPVPYQGLCF